MQITFLDVAIFFATFLLALFWYGKRKMTHFKGTGVKHVVPPIPYFGSTYNVAFGRCHFIDFLKDAYKMFPGEKYIGMYEGPRPLIILRDVDLIKRVAIKDFDHLPNHRPVVDENSDSLFGNNLVALQNDKWRDMRATLSPAFTSAKMKNMFVFIEECAKNVANHFLKECEERGKDTIEIEAKDTFSRYTNDTIANAAFGLQINSLKDTQNDFYTITKEATKFSGKQFFKFALFFMVPKLMRMLNIGFISDRIKNFYRGLVSDSMRTREQHHIIRNDMIHLLMEAKKGSLKHEKHSSSDRSDAAGFATVEESAIGRREVARKWTDDELVAQALVFLIGGFETSATFIAFFIYEMVRNPEVQRKLQCEIDEYVAEHGANITYSDLPKLNYLDCCVAESLRMWPPGLTTDRVCVNGYTLPPPNDQSQQSYRVNGNESVWIPIYPIHHDPKYYPDPEKFDPERFSDENKASLESGAYLPFGIGPRNCIGSRFALMVGKLIIFHILMKFTFVKTSKTQIPLILDKSTVNLLAKDGIHVGLQKRKL